MNFDKFLQASQKERTPIEKLEWSIGSIDRQIERLKSLKFRDEPGCYGTASADYSEVNWNISCLLKKREELEFALQNLKTQLPNA